MRLVAAALLLCAGCADLPDVESGTCGNLVVDFDEDCDGFTSMGEGTACGAPDGDNACFFVCDAESGSICPDGWGCGGDGRCRRPSGFFVEATGSPYRFAVQDFDIADVDGDGNADLVGNDVNALTVRFGADDGTFATNLDVTIPQAQGPVTVGQFDDDALADVVVPMRGGLFV
ncbi:MAG TPA: VCBS repeat-containing protein, partial [Kofleriaceae bacterium]|nr:VCBS repeat-containing protein [Kofleriaceae bacterium]